MAENSVAAYTRITHSPNERFPSSVSSPSSIVGVASLRPRVPCTCTCKYIDVLSRLYVSLSSILHTSRDENMAITRDRGNIYLFYNYLLCASKIERCIADRWISGVRETKNYKGMRMRNIDIRYLKNHNSIEKEEEHRSLLFIRCAFGFCLSLGGPLLHRGNGDFTNATSRRC